MSQLPLPLTLPESFSEGSFFISDCNREAYETVLDARNWQGHAMYLCGEKSSGKSHLAHIWQGRNRAQVIPVDAIKPELISDNAVVEDIENCRDEKSLLHLFNQCKDIGVKLLLTSGKAPSELPFILPDLTSRLRGAQVATIYPPDDALIESVMRKQFADRQLLVDEEVVLYLSARIERTLAGVRYIVETIDKNAMTERKNITIPFVKKILDSLSEPNFPALP